MAIARGAGTEIIRAHHFDDIDNTSTTLIKGVQHHIYTVLSVVCFCQAIQAAGNFVRMYIGGYDAKGGTTDSGIIIFENTGQGAGDTYVWNDKFSFNGFEPINFSGPMDDATKQDAIADQGSGVAQVLGMSTENAADNYEVTVTFIDQNNS